MDKIRAYNRLYQMREVANCPIGMASVTQIQDRQLAWIESSCAEHAIISLATAFETYYKAVVQELLFCFPEYFLKQKTNFSECLHALIESNEENSFEQIEEALNLRSRHSYYRFFKAHSIRFLSESEHEFIESVYLKRNSLVHTAGDLHDIAHGISPKNQNRRKEDTLRNQAKIMRTKFRNLITLLHERILDAVAGQVRP